MAKTSSLTLLYTSDVHGNAMPILYGTNEPADIGLAKYATIVKEAREANEHVSPFCRSGCSRDCGVTLGHVIAAEAAPAEAPALPSRNLSAQSRG